MQSGDANPSQVTPQNFGTGTHLYFWVESGTVRVKIMSCPRTQHSDPASFPSQRLNPEWAIALNMRTPPPVEEQRNSSGLGWQKEGILQGFAGRTKEFFRG